MSIEEAALFLDSCLSKDGLKVTVAVADEELMVYIHSGVGEAIIPPVWKGYRVAWERIGKMQPLARKVIQKNLEII
jgi:hypothetical protein